MLIIDTAGRLQNKANLMDELGKIRRVTEKNLPVDEVLLVLDATTGQNGMTQAKVFAEAIGITGVVLSKLDGSAKGGIVISVQKELGVPVKLVGLGEGPDDLAPFDPEASSTASSPELTALSRKPPRVGGFLFTPDRFYLLLYMADLPVRPLVSRLYMADAFEENRLRGYMFTFESTFFASESAIYRRNVSCQSSKSAIHKADTLKMG